LRDSLPQELNFCDDKVKTNRNWNRTENIDRAKNRQQGFVDLFECVISDLGLLNTLLGPWAGKVVVLDRVFGFETVKDNFKLKSVRPLLSRSEIIDSSF
jgi:hypothetical protein